MRRVFIDTNVVIDVFTQREGYQSSFAILSLSENKLVEAYVSQGSVYTTLYLLRKLKGNSEARANVKTLLEIVKVAACNTLDSIAALDKIAFSDPEDALQHQTALSVHAEVIITRDKKDFKQSAIPVYSPEEYLELKE